MLRLILRRLLALVPLLLIVSVLAFSFTSLLPSDPADLIIGDTGTEQQCEMVRERLGLDDRWSPATSSGWDGRCRATSAPRSSTAST